MHVYTQTNESSSQNLLLYLSYTFQHNYFTISPPSDSARIIQVSRIIQLKISNEIAPNLCTRISFKVSVSVLFMYISYIVTLYNR